jgi:hypothetical protein
MLTIKNLNKLNNIELGKKNFYVARIEEQVSIDNISLTASEHQYKFELSNRKYAITVTLDRSNPKLFVVPHYKLTSSTGKVLYITGKQISNIDIFIDQLRFVALG